MKLLKKTRLINIIHFTCITVLISLCVVIPIVYNLTGTPPYWAMMLIFGILCILYLTLVIMIYFYKRRKQQQDEEEVHIAEEQEDIVSSVESYDNPSTTGIPPSSYLAPNQASIRSSSLDITAPPAYQEMMYPPSYRSTNSTKDDSPLDQ
ncbi:uncharacterized protein B0P05DRAFT_552582 [Gilbertella persicaria]|uniref:uncharacterized protein n=1 Tax=Gilbertella persicaria TaxID=101096 RepID=UPI0022203BBA|nr:uncharacterized protein B0P05DRAFT_552582 [Gilbertella persicaria]KAI8067695.1 hypothetical protein B0P05DRAFT_552582 [Gilbertella persicaria]